MPDQENRYIDSVNIKNLFLIKDLFLEGLGDKKEIYFLGENGDGKTLLLQGIVLAFGWEYLSQKLPTEVAEALDVMKGRKREDFVARLKNGVVINATPREPARSAGDFTVCFAYGVSRNSLSGDSHLNVMSLFARNRSMQNPEHWLKDLYLKDLEGTSAFSLGTAKALLNQVLDKGIDIEVSSDGVTFKEKGSDLKLNQLSEGYRSVMMWVIDFLSRLNYIFPFVSNTKDFRGVCIVDEIGLHLHPKWEMKLVRQLREWFPGIQFFFTTHSPVTILGASDDAVFYKLYKENSEVKVSRQYSAHEMRHQLANGLITSPLFDLTSARMRALGKDELPDTSESYLHSRVHDAVRKRLDKLKADGKVHFETQEVDALIAEALDSFES